MYSPNVIERTLDAFEAQNAWRPTYHTIGEVEEFSAYIESLVKIEKNQTNKYIDMKDGVRLTERRKKEIQKWIVNEQFLCFADSAYWESRYAWICNDKNEIFRYKPRKSQEIFHKILEPFDENQYAIELFCIKSRQVGITTAVAMKFKHRLNFIPHTQAVMASVKATNSELIGRMLEICEERQPFWLGPSKTSTRASTPQWSNGSILSIQSGSQAMGIAQGWTPTCIHVSEIADIPRPKKVLEEGLFPAAHSSRKLFFVLEGTGGDSTSWQADKWRYYKAEYGKGGRFMCMFITWPCASDLYPQPDWLRQHPIPEAWRPLDETKRMQRKAELYIRSTDYLARIMGGDWAMPPEQAWFWETKYREAVQSHTVKVFLSQYPVTDDEALQSKDDLVFSDEVIYEVGNRREKEYEAYAITGKSVLIGQNDEPYEPDPSEIDYEKPRIPVQWKSKSGQMNFWEMVPLREFKDADDTLCFNKVLIFKHPEEGCNYSIGIDTADGLGYPDEDRSVCTVLENHTGMQRDEEAATFVSNGVNPPQMVSIAACLAAYYGQWHDNRAHTKDPRGAKFIIEQRARYGDDCQFQLKLMGFFWHHRFHTYDDKVVRSDNARKIGWFSNAWSVPMLLNRFTDALQGGWLKISHPMTLRQLKTLVRKTASSGKTKLDHESGKHDDNLRAIAMAYFTSHSDDILVNRQQAKYGNPDEKMPAVNYDWCENTITV
jgi:hypothetical protein